MNEYETAADISRLTVARQAAHDLNRLQQAAAELPILEKQEQERLRRQELQRQKEVLADRAERLVHQYELGKRKSNLEVLEAVKHCLDVAASRNRLEQTTGTELWEVALALAEIKISLGQGRLGGWGNSFNDNDLAKRAEAEQIIIDLGVKFGSIRPDDNTQETRDFLTFLGQFCPIRLEDNEPKPITQGLFPIINHAGEIVWKP